MNIISLIVIHYGDAKLLWNLLDSLERHPDKELFDEVIVVNNGLTLDEKNYAELERYKALPVQVVNNPQKNYASGLNRGAASARGDILIISNNDVEWLPNSSIQPLLDRATEDKTGIVGPQLVYPDGTWQPSHWRFFSLNRALISLTMLDSLRLGVARWAFRHGFLPRKPRKVDQIIGAFMVIRRTCYEELNGFNQDYSFYGEDSDFCWRAARNGWKVLFVPTSRMVHIGGATSAAKALEEYSVQYFKSKVKFATERFGPRQTKWFAWLIKVAYLERTVLYGFAARLIGTSDWKNRAQRAKAHYQATRELDTREDGLG